MRIALDIRPLQNESGARGVGRYVRSLIEHLPPGVDEYLLLESVWLPAGELHSGCGEDGESRRFENEGNGPEMRRVRLWRPPRAITLFDQAATPLLCARMKIGVFHSTFYALPALRTRATRFVLTVHDLIPLVIPGAASVKNSAIFRQIYRSALGADAVIVPSARTADDLERLVGVPRARIRVIPMGVGAPFLREVNGVEPQGTPPSLVKLRETGRRVLLYAGGFNATKNVPFLFDALSALPGEEAVLCIVGDPGPAMPALRAGASERGIADRVLYLGRMDDEGLAAGYRAADLFVSASLYEGFGLPALEAMACGCPVVALTCGTVPEVLAGAAIGVQEKDPGAFASAVARVLASDPLRTEMGERGLQRASELTWEKTARETAALYHELAGKRTERSDA